MAKRERIIQGIDEADKLLFGRSFEDIVYYVILPPMGIVVLNMMGFFSFSTLISSILLQISVTIIIFRLADDTEPATEFLQSKYHQLTLPHYIPLKIETDGGTDKDVTHPSPEAIENVTDNPDSVPFWKASMAASDLTGIENVYPRYNAIELTNGHLLGVLKVTGTDLFLKGEASEDELIRSLGNSLNNIENETEFYITTSPFDIESFKESQRMALNHEKIKTNIPLQLLAEGFDEQILNDTRLEEVYERELYAIITIDPSDSENILTESKSFADRLKSSVMSDSSDDVTFSEIDLKNLKTGLNVLQGELQNAQQRINSIPEVTASPIAVEDALGIVRGHYRGPARKQPIDIPTMPLSAAVEPSD